MDNLFDELTWRGMVFDATEGLSELLAKEPVTAYIGFDPTAPSLHVGSLLTVMGLARLQRFGHSPIAIVGGGTGMIGDPSGKSQERVLLSPERIDENVAGVRAQLERFLDFEPRAGAPPAARIVNNADWLATIDLISFLRDAGKYFTVNYMLQKESVNRRLESEEGISFTEFSYLVLQAYDFLQMFDRFGCALQMGGSDQWGNITAGIDLIRKLRGKKAHGLVWPLMKTASGTKFGKTEAGTVWLDPARTSPFRFYQFWLNIEDRDVVAYLKSFTFLDRREIERARGGDRRVPRAPRGAARAGARGHRPRPRRRIRWRGPSKPRACCSGNESRSLRLRTCWPCSRMCRRRKCRPRMSIPMGLGWSISLRACSSRRRRARRGVSCSRAACT